MPTKFIRLSQKSERLFASVLDCFLMGLGALILVMLYVFLEEYLGKWPLYALPLLVIFKDTKRGGSVGKFLMEIGVRLRRNPNEIPSRWRLIMRNITLILIWPIEIICAFSSKYGERLGDKLAGTIVVKLEEVDASQLTATPVKEKRKLNPIYTKIFLWGLASLFFITGLLSIPIFIFRASDAYEATITYLQTNEQVLQASGGIDSIGFIANGQYDNTSGYKQGNCMVKVNGQENDLQINALIHKKPDSEWVIDQISIKPYSVQQWWMDIMK